MSEVNYSYYQFQKTNGYQIYLRFEDFDFETQLSEIVQVMGFDDHGHFHGIRERISKLESKFYQKRMEGSLAHINHDNIAVKGALSGHTKTRCQNYCQKITI